jgi:hypothetical protein
VSKVYAIYSGFVGLDGVPVLLTDGAEYDDSHPLVQARPELFTEPRRSPGRPAGSKNKSAAAND